MQLITFTLQGYRRFVARTSVKLHSDLISFVGPNEAGKSSILKALGHLNSDEPLARNELPRRSAGVDTMLKWQFQLEPGDREALEEIPEARNVQRVSITKAADGRRDWILHPPVLRDQSLRSEVRTRALLSRSLIESTARGFNIGLDFDGLVELLSSEDDYADTQLGQLESFATVLDEMLDAIPAAEIDVSADEMTRSLSQQLTALRELDNAKHPKVLARAALEPRLPLVRLFDVADRELKTEYDLNEEADAPSPALRHLADLCGLDLVALRDEIALGEIADASTRRNKANEALRAVFAAWKQETIALQLEFQGPLLHVQVTTPGDDGLSSIDDRSEGMRWFATLLAFTHGAGDRPIMLADEIETHLHYDAQADLVEVLSNQDLTSKVIYTTHSFGCLPNDLGNGVRVVQPLDGATSTIKNGFWEGGSGFSPLLVSMGAAAVTFTPTRRAILGEGATEAIILPTLLRQAAELPKLNFQVAPGLSSVAAANVPDLESEAGQVAYLVDGDPGGLAIKAVLEKTVAPERIVVLRDPEADEPLETEDLIDPVVYATAANEELRLWNSMKSEIKPGDLPMGMRTKAVEAWCKKRHVAPPDKAAVAQRVANLSYGRDVFAAARQALIVQLLASLEIALSGKS